MDDDDPLAALRAVVRRLEDDPGMRKGRLIEAAIRHPNVDWPQLFRRLRPRLRGRHRERMRWRRAVTCALLQRSFPRGARRDDAHLLAAFRPNAVWQRFRSRFPVLAVYRVAWTPCDATAAAARPARGAWDGLWHGRRQPTLLDLARVLHWPLVLTDAAVTDRIPPLAQRLWPRKPWRRWMEGGNGAVRRRAAVPYLRRAACLVHGFLARGTLSLGSVWEAIVLPSRGAHRSKEEKNHGQAAPVEVEEAAQDETQKKDVPVGETQTAREG